MYGVSSPLYFNLNFNWIYICLWPYTLRQKQEGVKETNICWADRVWIIFQSSIDTSLTIQQHPKRAGDGQPGWKKQETFFVQNLLRYLRLDIFFQLIPKDMKCKPDKMITFSKLVRDIAKGTCKSAIPSMQRILNRDKQKQLVGSTETNLKSLCVTNKLCLLGYIVVTINFIFIITRTSGRSAPLVLVPVTPNVSHNSSC